MNKAKMFKIGLNVLSVVLTISSTLVNDKVKDNKLDETIAKKIEEALSNQAKGS